MSAQLQQDYIYIHLLTSLCNFLWTAQSISAHFQHYIEGPAPIAGTQTSNHENKIDTKKKKKERGKLYFCTAIGQTLISQVLPNSKLKNKTKSLVCTDCILSPSPMKSDHFPLRCFTSLPRQCLSKSNVWLSLSGHTPSLWNMQVKPIFLGLSHWGVFEVKITDLNYSMCKKVIKNLFLFVLSWEYLVDQRLPYHCRKECFFLLQILFWW